MQSFLGFVLLLQLCDGHTSSFFLHSGPQLLNFKIQLGHLLGGLVLLLVADVHLLLFEGGNLHLQSLDGALLFGQYLLDSLFVL